MSRALSLIIYNLCLPFGLLAMAPGALVKMRRRGGQWRDFRERLGLLDENKLAAIRTLPRAGGRYWIHAVSVGEVEIAKKLISRMLVERADCSVVLTTTTPTGRQLADEFASRSTGAVIAAYSPLDLPFVVRRMLRAIEPATLVLVEAEVWPNLVNTAARAGVPIQLVNARLSPRSERRYQQLGWLVKPVFGMLSRVLAQEQGDVARWAGLGVEPARITCTGSVKFDPQDATVNPAQLTELRAVLANTGWNDGDPVLLAASTHPGEETEIAKVFQAQQSQVPDLRLIIVPRHVERTAEVADQLRAMGLDPVLRSEVAAQPIASRCLLVNTTGELRAWQHLASVVVIGKSFHAGGGQNPAEALMAGKPVVFGPHMENFAALAEVLLQAGGAVQVPDFTALERECGRLLLDPALAGRIAAAGHGALARHEGATMRTARLVLGITGPESTAPQP